ncbi:MAG: hypothetical protein PHH54_01820 [Candidatus Nanoarchaeia archaeon]|nr:hypothetical protein [Candidatus Nanoarchaeia archaeon]MDD5740700.1 hypothetical protein [Candidatus Nanoarchaeia archaeon]
MDKIIITKKIARQGKNSVIIIPTCLKEEFKPGNIVKIEITNLKIKGSKN